MKKKCLLLIVLLLMVITLSGCGKKEEKKPQIDINSVSEFDYKIIKQTHNYHSKENYMISPLSIAYALSMLNEGAGGNTKDEITKVLGDYKLNTNVNVKDKISIANLIFIRTAYKNDISEEYISKLRKDYDSDLIFDEFNTPKPVNDWVSKKTFNMINDAVEEIPKDFVLGLANAIAIDVDWKIKFDCIKTRNDEFTKEDNSKIQVSMMHSSNDISYIESDNAKGIIKDYAIYDKTTGKIVYKENDNTVSLEYIAILPNKSIDEYMSLFNKEELNKLLNSKKEPSNKLDINLSLPKYTYDFDYKEFQDALISLGIKDVFDSNNSNLSNMVNKDSMLELFVSKSIHKSHIELSENGTKAAAVTIFMTEKNAIIMPEEKEVINIEFNRPFIYLIKEKNNDNIWFFGTVYEPMLWENNDTNNCRHN